MKIKMLAVGVGPCCYSFDGSRVIVHKGRETSVYDFAGMEDGDIAEMNQFGGCIPIRQAQKVSGEIHLELCQVVGAGHWLNSDWLDSDIYDPEKVYVKLDTTKPFTGVATVLTKSGVKNINSDNGELA